MPDREGEDGTISVEPSCEQQLERVWEALIACNVCRQPYGNEGVRGCPVYESLNGDPGSVCKHAVQRGSREEPPIKYVHGPDCNSLVKQALAAKLGLPTD